MNENINPETGEIITGPAEIVPTPDVSITPSHGMGAVPEGLKSYLWKPGQSGNPAGRPKKTEQEKELMDQIRSLGPKTYEAMKTMLENGKTPAVAKVKLIEIILAYILGKPDVNVKLTNVTDASVEAQERIVALVRDIRIKPRG